MNESLVLLSRCVSLSEIGAGSVDHRVGPHDFVPKRIGRFERECLVAIRSGFSRRLIPGTVSEVWNRASARGFCEAPRTQVGRSNWPCRARPDQHVSISKQRGQRYQAEANYVPHVCPNALGP